MAGQARMERRLGRSRPLEGRSLHPRRRNSIRWPAAKFDTGALDGKRSVAVKLLRPGRRPLVVHNCYLNATCPAQRADQGLEIGEWIVEHNEDTVILGN